MKIRAFVEKFYARSGVAKLVIRKTEKEGSLIIFASKVGMITGREGSKIKEFETKLQEKFGKNFKVTVKAVKKPELSAKIMAEHIADKLEARMPFRRVAKQALKQIMDAGAVGVKIKI